MPKVTQGVSCRGRIQTQRPALHLVFRQGPPVPEAACALADRDAAGRGAHARRPRGPDGAAGPMARNLIWGARATSKRGVRGRMRPRGEAWGSETICPAGAAQPERTRGSEAPARPLAKCGQPPSPALEPRESLGTQPRLVGRPQDRESGSGFPAWSNPRSGECLGAREP